MIKFNEIIKDKEYRERVIKYFALPIRLSVSEEKFLSDMEFIKQVDKDKYDKIVKLIEHDFNKECEEQETNNPDFTMESVLEPLIESLESSSEWQEFLKQDYSDVLDDYEGITNTHGFYKKENDGKHFVSVDLKSANWQSLQSIIGFKETYEELIVKYTDNLIPPVSKTFRTKITGIMGARKIMDYNKKLLKDNKDVILNSVCRETGVNLMDKNPFAFYADEFIIEIDKMTKDKLNSLNLEVIEKEVYKKTGVAIHFRVFTLKWLGVNKACAKIYNDDYEILNISKDILLLINKLIHDIQIKEIDFEKIKLGKRSKEDFLEDLRKSIKGFI